MKSDNSPTQTTDRGRPAKVPRSCDCIECGCVFVGEEWHILCRVCIEQIAGDIAKVQHG